MIQRDRNAKKKIRQTKERTKENTHSLHIQKKKHIKTQYVSVVVVDFFSFKSVFLSSFVSKNDTLLYN